MSDVDAYYTTLRLNSVPALVSLMPRSTTLISGFYPIKSEIDCSFVLREISSVTGLPVCLPIVESAGQPLIFRLWDCNEDSLISGEYGIKVPGMSCPEGYPDFVIAPFIGFDSSLNRLGYGGGFYDRTLKILKGIKPIVAVGFGFSEQWHDEIPHDDHDIRVDAVVTELGLFCN